MYLSHSFYFQYFYNTVASHYLSNHSNLESCTHYRATQTPLWRIFIAKNINENAIVKLNDVISKLIGV